jgi:hypothetical protein
MDQRIESFLTDVLALAGEEPDAVGEGVRFAPADCEAIFRAREDNKRMKDQAARICRVLCRTRAAAEMHQISRECRRVGCKGLCFIIAPDH